MDFPPTVEHPAPLATVELHLGLLGTTASLGLRAFMPAVPVPREDQIGQTLRIKSVLVNSSLVPPDDQSSIHHAEKTRQCTNVQWMAPPMAIN